MNDRKLAPETFSAVRLKNENLVGTGLTAEVFSWGDGRVLKLFFPWRPVSSVERELRATQAVHAAGLPAPEPFELVQIEGRRGIVFERVWGASLFRQVERKPWTLFAGARQLAELHARLHARAAPTGLPAQREQIEGWIDSAEGFSEAWKKEAMDCVARLPAGEALCHGDFHPGNIMMTSDGPVIIDWSGATRGCALADVARSSVLFERAKMPAGTPLHIRLLIRVARRALHSAYLSRYFELRPGAKEEIEACRAVQRIAGEAWWAGQRAAMAKAGAPMH